MYKNIISMLFLAISLASCEPEPIQLDNFDRQTWVNDKDGCNGDRKAIVESIIAQKDKLMAREQEQITDLLGKPDMHELYKRSQYFLVYSIDPGNNCPNYIADKKAANLTIRFNALGRVNEVVYYK